jgi:hypothetical protein
MIVQHTLAKTFCRDIRLLTERKYPGPGCPDFNHHRSTWGKSRNKLKCGALYMKNEVKLRGGWGRWRNSGAACLFIFCQNATRKGGTCWGREKTRKQDLHLTVIAKNRLRASGGQHKKIGLLYFPFFASRRHSHVNYVLESNS